MMYGKWNRYLIIGQCALLLMVVQPILQLLKCWWTRLDFFRLVPDARAHAAHGSARRLATSKTMSVQEVVEYATNLRPVLKHLKNSGKFLCLLNDALKLLEMKQMKTLAWCPSRMGYILTSSKRCTELLVRLADVLASCDIKKENASYFISPKCIAIMHILYVEEVLMEKFIRRLDGDNSVIIDVFHESENAVAALNNTKVTLLNLFLDGLTEDDNGNIVLTTTATSDIGETISDVNSKLHTSPRKKT